MTTLNLPVRILCHVVMLRAAGVTATVVEDGANRWMLTIDPGQLPEGDALGVFFIRRHNGKFRTQVDLVVDGEPQDVKSLADAIVRLGQRTAKGGTSPVSGASASARSNPVEVRRASVIRV